MGNYNKWNKGESQNFVSRNKDNKDVENFTERRNAFTTTQIQCLC